MGGNTQKKSVEIDTNGHSWVWEPCPFHRRIKEDIKRCKTCNEDGFIYIDLDGAEKEEYAEGETI